MGGRYVTRSNSTDINFAPMVYSPNICFPFSDFELSWKKNEVVFQIKKKQTKKDHDFDLVMKEGFLSNFEEKNVKKLLEHTKVEKGVFFNFQE